jgi:hypothetical protein
MEKPNKKYVISCGGWSVVAGGRNSEEASTLAIEKMVKAQGDQLPISPVIESLCLSDLEEELELEQYREFIYCPKILSNAGFHETAKKFTELINEKTKTS